MKTERSIYEPISGSEAYSWCEPSMATGKSPWHIRKLDDGGHAFGGGVSTPSLCGHIQPRSAGGWGGWDVNAKITPKGEEYACRQCWELFQSALAGSTSG